LSEGGPTPVVGRGLLSDCRATGRAKSGCDDELKATVSERRAGVHRSFVSNHFAGQLPHANAEMKSQCIAGLDGQTALSAASLRVEMETDKHHADEAQQEILSLKGRLVRALGEQIAAKHPEHGVFSATVRTCAPRSSKLLVSHSGLGWQLRDTQEEIGAARRLNRMLIRERNSGVTERQP
jgi:hypothetical protein